MAEQQLDLILTVNETSEYFSEMVLGPSETLSDMTVLTKRGRVFFTSAFLSC